MKPTSKNAYGARKSVYIIVKISNRKDERRIGRDKEQPIKAAYKYRAHLSNPIDFSVRR